MPHPLLIRDQRLAEGVLADVAEDRRDEVLVPGEAPRRAQLRLGVAVLRELELQLAQRLARELARPAAPLQSKPALAGCVERAAPAAYFVPFTVVYAVIRLR